METNKGASDDALEIGIIGRGTEILESADATQEIGQLALWNTMAKRPDYVTLADSQLQAL